MSKFVDLFLFWLSAPDAQDVAEKELREAKVELLKEQSRLEFSASLVGYHTKRVRRLEKYIKQFDEQKGKSSTAFDPGDIRFVSGQRERHEEERSSEVGKV